VSAPAGASGRWHRFRQDRGAVLAAIVLGTVALLALLAPVVSPYDPAAQLDITALKNARPSRAHWFGTDVFSRDVLSRVLHGARVSLGVAVLAVTVSVTVGTAYGAVAGYAGGRVDSAMMRLVDTLLSLPRVLLLIAVLALWGTVPTPWLVLVLGLTGWFGVSRLARGQVLAYKEREFAVAARALGASDARILVRHVLPHVAAPVLVSATLGVGNVIALEAGLSYLGIGVQPPNASWGSILLDGSEFAATAWWVALAPGLAIVLTVLSVNVLGDGLRDTLDPRHVDGR
jgi:peptide/nickel transport system permease protein